ncbi:MAG TPA: hypothetical protein VLV86_04280 [Vicinamibacterales bacterium]|nr:hypothetical protein [Vicinamibacterales bacterium]
MEEPTSAEVVHAALEGLLEVIATSSEDFRLFHDAISKARLTPLPSFPREAVVLTESIAEKLTRVDQELEELVLALGVPRPTRPK